MAPPSEGGERLVHRREQIEVRPGRISTDPAGWRRAHWRRFGVACAGEAPPELPDGGSPPAGSAATAPAPAEPEPPKPDSHRLSLEWKGGEREYLLDVPTTYVPGEPTPLVLVFHGMPGTAAEVRFASKMDTFAEERGFLVAYPDQVRQVIPPDPATDTQDDLGFVRAVTEHLIEEWNAAPGRIYAAGFSRGATFSYRLAMEAPDLFAAVAPISGVPAMPREWVDPVPSASVISFVGMRDRGTAEVAAVPWREAMGCAAGAPATLDDAPHVTRIEANCRDGSEVVEYHVGEMGHEWPTPDRDGIDANALIGDFFAAHARDAG